MLDKPMKEQLQELFAALDSRYTLSIEVDEMHPERDTLLALLEDVASCSEKIDTIIVDGEELLFEVLKDGEACGIIFRAVPNGHEFTSLLMAIFNLDGKGKNIPDEVTVERIKALKGEVAITTYVSLTCPNCPEVVQALNLIAALNPSVTHTTVDGAINQAEAELLFVKSVPSTFLNGELLHVGSGNLSMLLSKLEEKVEREVVVPSELHQEFDVLVVGGGPAGCSAAIYSARKGLSVAIVASTIGGQVKETVSIENLISTQQTTGTQLALDLFSHLKDYPIAVLENREIISIEVVDGKKKMGCNSGEHFTAAAVIVATGAAWRKLEVAGEDEYLGRGVAFCPHCDGPIYQDKNVAVIGGGNSGVEAALDLAGTSRHVTIIELMDDIKADKILQEKASSATNISILCSTMVKEIKGDGDKVTALELVNRKTEESYEFAVDGVFVQVGMKPNYLPFDSLVETNNAGEIIIDGQCRTSHMGIYAAGDVTNTPYKQIIIAMGEGAKAALAAFDDRVRDMLLERSDLMIND